MSANFSNFISTFRGEFACGCLKDKRDNKKREKMKQIIIIVSFVAAVWSMMPEKCRPSNLPNVTFDECCALGVDLIPKDILQKCDAANPMPPMPPPPPPSGALPGPPRGCCYAECVMKELKIFADGKFNKEAAKTALGNAIKSKPELKPIIDNAIDKCAADGESKKALFDEGAKLPPIPPSNQTCNMMSAFETGCIYAQIYLQCPNYTQKPECSALKEIATDCGFVMPKKKN